MKYTPRLLREWKKSADMLLKEWNRMDQKIRKHCYHPDEYLDTTTYTRTDTLGNNPEKVTNIVCRICGTYLE